MIMLEPVAVVMIVVMMVAVVMIMVVVVVVDLQEMRLDVENAIEIEGALVEHGVDLDIALLSMMKPGIGIDGADSRLDLAQFRRRNEIGLVEDDHVGEGDLVLRLGRVAKARGQPFGVGDGDDGIEPRVLLHILINEEGLRDGRGVGEARRLENDCIEAPFALHQSFHDADEIATHRAADTAVVHLENFLVGADDEFIVDADLAEFVDDHGVALAVRLAEDAVEQSGLSGAEIAGEDGHGNFFGRSGGRSGQGADLRTR